MRSVSRLLRASVLSAALSLSPSHARAQPAAYFQGRTITIFVTNPPGGGFDLTARVLARHLGHHVPGHPTVIVANMPGAHGITGANYIFNIAPRDGTALGAVVPYLPQYQVQGVAGLQYDAPRFTWIGSVGDVHELLYVWHTVPVRSVADLRNHETILATAGPVETFARLLSATVGARFKLVKGYAGTQETHLALERGEVEAALSSYSVLRAYWPEWVAHNKVRMIVRNGFERDPELPDVPATVELAGTPADRAVLAFFAGSTAIGRAYVAPPDLRAEVRAILRAGFDATMRDPGFVAESRNAKLDVVPLTGDDLDRVVAGMMNVDAATRDRIRDIVGNEL